MESKRKSRREVARKPREPLQEKTGKASASAGVRDSVPVPPAEIPPAGAALAQDPHAVRGGPHRRLELAIGHEVRTLRKQLGITVADLGEATGLSTGMLSKIENGLTSPSLTTLQLLARALGVSVSTFLRSFDEATRAAVHVQAGMGVESERRGSRAGHQYQLLGYLGPNDSGVTVEPYMITLTRDSDVFPTFQHEGLEYLYMLEGVVEYRHGERTFLMRPGDSLFFDANAPHGPERLVELPARYLAIITYPQGGRPSGAPASPAGS